MTQVNAKKQLGHGINYGFVNSFTIQSILLFSFCHFVFWVLIYCHFHVNMILAKWSLFHGCLTLATWYLSPLSHFVFGAFNHNRVTSVTTRDVFGAMMIFVLVANFSYFVILLMWNILFKKTHYFHKIKKFEGKNITQRCNTFFAFVLYVKQSCIWKEQIDLKKLEVKGEICLESLLYLHIS